MEDDRTPDDPAGRDRQAPAPLRWIAGVEKLVGCLALLTIFVMVLTQALQRYLPVAGWAWTGELARYCLVWLTFSMVGYLMGRGDHITLQVVDNVKSRAVRHGVHVFANLVVAAVSVGFVLEGFHLVTAQTGQVSPALQMPLQWLYVIPLAGFALTVLRAVVAVLTERPDPPRETPAARLQGEGV